MAACNVVIRFLILGFTVFAAAFMFRNKQTSIIGGFQITATYEQSSAFKFFVIGNAVAGAYALFSALVLCIRRRNDGRFLPVLDLIATCLLMASVAAAAAIGGVAKYGNDDIGWQKVCVYYQEFCRRSVISIVSSFVGFFLLFLVSVSSTVHRSRLNDSP